MEHLQEQVVWPPQSIRAGLQANPETLRDLPKKVVLRLVPLAAETRNQMEAVGLYPLTELVCKYDPESLCQGIVKVDIHQRIVIGEQPQGSFELSFHPGIVNVFPAKSKSELPPRDP